jgi:hypothetical protein
MIFREIIKTQFGVDLPISGGIGNSIDNAVVIEHTPLNDYVSVEHQVLKYIALGRGLLDWKIISQQLLFENGKSLDKLQVKVIFKKDGQLFESTENHYFDITDCTNFHTTDTLNDDDKQIKDMQLFLKTLKEKIDE